MSGGFQTLDLFDSAGNDARTESPEGGISGSEAGREPIQEKDEGSGSDAREKTSIEAFAQRQADLRAAGIASATAFWAKRGVKYP